MAAQRIDLSPIASGAARIDAVTFRLHPDDDVVIARVRLAPGLVLESDRGSLRVRQLIPVGHKVAVRELHAGDSVHRYGQIIGFTTQAIAAGDHVHSHNLAVGEFSRDYAFST